jgi:hypothetical protein
VLGRLIRNADTIFFTQLTGPHSCTIDHFIAFDHLACVMSIACNDINTYMHETYAGILS